MSTYRYGQTIQREAQALERLRGQRTRLLAEIRTAERTRDLAMQAASRATEQADAALVRESEITARVSALRRECTALLDLVQHLRADLDATRRGAHDARLSVLYAERWGQAA